MNINARMQLRKTYLELRDPIGCQQDTEELGIYIRRNCAFAVVSRWQVVAADWNSAWDGKSKNRSPRSRLATFSVFFSFSL